MANFAGYMDGRRWLLDRQPIQSSEYRALEETLIRRLIVIIAG
jgi:hypothetical protein